MFAITALLTACLASNAFAINWWVKRQDDRPASQCNGLISNYLGGTYCCPGIIFNDDDSSQFGSAFCCVGARFPAAPSLSRFTDCFPNCQATATATNDDVGILPVTTTPSCRATIMLTDTAYVSKVNSAGSSIGASVTTGSTSPAPTDATLTRTETDDTTSGRTSAGTGTTLISGTQTGTTASATTTGTTRTGTAASASASTSSSTGASSGSGAKMTSGPMAGALAIAGGVLVAAL